MNKSNRRVSIVATHGKNLIIKFFGTMSRFGNSSAVDIDKNGGNLTPTNTKNSKTSVKKKTGNFAGNN